jgi:hypothetical protein
MDISEIQRQMAQIRNEMHQEVQGAVRSAQSLTDWQNLVKGHPWLSLSLAAVVGYALVPKRHPQVVPSIVTMSAANPMLTPITTARAPERVKGRWRILGSALGLVAPVAVRVAQNYVLGHVEEWLSQQRLPADPARSRDGGRESGPSARREPAQRLREYG